jgi:signal transduction histidine kinase/PAS domain-containing protein/AmiR/NasT family two-component response regulator
MSRPATNGAPAHEPAADDNDPVRAGEQARRLLASMHSFLAEADRLSARIRVAVTLPVGLLCILGWAMLSLFGTLFQGQARHPEIMLAAGLVLLLIGLHAWIHRGPEALHTAVLATVIVAVYGCAVLINGTLPTLFLGAVIIALHSVAQPRVALTLSLAALVATPPLVFLASAEQVNHPHLFRIMLTGVMSITFLQLLCRANVRFKAEALRVAQGLEAMMVPLGSSLEQALFERRRAEDALAATQAADERVVALMAQLEDAVGSMSQGLVMVNAEGRVVLCNPQTQRILDLPAGTLDPQDVFADLLESQTERGELDGGGTQRNAPSSPIELKGDQPDGSVSRTVDTRDGRHVEMNSRRMHSGHTVHTFTDVTGYVHSNEKLRAAMLGMTCAQDQLNAEMRRARQESDMKLRFVTSVSHEIRTPLNGITGMVDLLARSGLNDQQATLVDDVRTSTRQLRQLTDDILDLSHLKDSRFPLSLAPFDLTDAFEKAVRAAQGAAQAKGLSLELLMRDAPCVLIGDARRLTQLLNNLVYNAIKFTTRGSVRVHVEWPQVNSDSDGVEVVISVADSGRGIAPHLLGSIFEPFHQGDESINRDFGGTGLGLALCRELSDAMGGTIRVASRLGHGSVFTVMVMLQRGEGNEVFADTQPGGLDEHTTVLEGKRILVVDNRINRKLLTIWLSEAGAKVQMATDGAEGLRAATAEAFDVILMDISMPVMNGLDATRAIRLLVRSADERERLRSMVPVIGVTAMAGPEDLKRCLEAGMDAHLSKPLSRNKLLRTLADVISAHAWLSNVSTQSHP